MAAVVPVELEAVLDEYALELLLVAAGVLADLVVLLLLLLPQPATLSRAIANPGMNHRERIEVLL